MRGPTTRRRRRRRKSRSKKKELADAVAGGGTTGQGCGSSESQGDASLSSEVTPNAQEKKEEQEAPPTDGADCSGGSPFVEQKRRASRVREGADGTAQFYLGGCSPSYTHYDLRRFLKLLNFEGVRCWRLAGGGPAERPSSFKIQVGAEDGQRLLDLEHWENHGLRVRKFFEGSREVHGPSAASVGGPAAAPKAPKAAQ